MGVPPPTPKICVFSTHTPLTEVAFRRVFTHLNTHHLTDQSVTTDPPLPTASWPVRWTASGLGPGWTGDWRVKLEVVGSFRCQIQSKKGDHSMFEDLGVVRFVFRNFVCLSFRTQMERMPL